MFFFPLMQPRTDTSKLLVRSQRVSQPGIVRLQREAGPSGRSRRTQASNSSGQGASPLRSCAAEVRIPGGRRAP